MHGRKKAEYKSKQNDPVISAAIAQKARQYNALSRELLARRKNQSPVPAEKEETWKLTEKLLSVNPDPNFLWNYRRELMQDDESSFSLFDINTELSLTAVCLRRNPKAYAAWTHRKWSIRHWLLPQKSSDEKTTTEKLLQSELDLCAEFLQLDERNFHCWNYRRFVVAAMAFSSAGSEGDLDGSWNWALSDSTEMVIMGPQLSLEKTGDQRPSIPLPDHLLAKEWDFSSEKIQSNFSNYSAFHYRSKLLPLILQQRKRDEEHFSYKVVLELVATELEIVQNAIFTEPDDQTPWWYHRFILSWSSPSSHSFIEKDEENKASYQNLLQKEHASIRDLVEMEEGQCKWGYLAICTILSLYLENGSDDEEAVGEWKMQGMDCLEKLKIIDKDRSVRYGSMKRMFM